MPKSNNSNLSNGKQRTSNKVWKLQEDISKASLSVRADLSNDFKSIIFETDQRKLPLFIRLFWEKQQKHLHSS